MHLSEDLRGRVGEVEVDGVLHGVRGEQPQQPSLGQALALAVGATHDHLEHAEGGEALA